MIVQDLLKSLSDHGVVSTQDLRAALTPDPPDSRTIIAQRLVDAGKITDFQAAAICEGRLADLGIGNYVILDRLGAGGMGTVFKARHRRMKRIVAIKFLSPNVSKNPILVQRFQREVEAIAKLNHPNIVAAYDADECSMGHFLVMEYVLGDDLASAVCRHGPMPVREAVDCIAQTARAMQYAHSQNIVHRDIKPANLLRDAQGTVKVTDLGLARFSDSPGGAACDAHLTQVGAVAGTVDFMAPEQALNTRLADRRSDIYSLGCTLFYLLTGRCLFQGETVLEKLLAHREQPPQPLGEIRSDVQPALDAVFLRMVAKDPSKRHQSMDEVSAELTACPLGVLQPAAMRVPDQPPMQLEPTSDEASDAGLAGLSVVVAEPSRTQAGLISNFLRQVGISRTRTCTSGSEVLSQLGSEAVVVSSLHLPDMTATELLQRLRANGRGVGFVLVSTATDTIQESLGPRTAVLMKPFGRDGLRDAILQVVPGAESPRPKPHLPHTAPDAGSMPKVHAPVLKALIVDDSVVARRRVRKMLDGLGHDVAEADNGTQACELLNSEAFDIVFTDYNMREMDGRGLLQFIRQRSSQRSIPVVMITTETDPQLLATVEQLGVTSICRKDVEVGTIRDILARTVGCTKIQNS
jgi:serine/threonine protein kinase/ActR/RegA family two-component response regulator